MNPNARLIVFTALGEHQDKLLFMKSPHLRIAIPISSGQARPVVSEGTSDCQYTAQRARKRLRLDLEA